MSLRYGPITFETGDFTEWENVPPSNTYLSVSGTNPIDGAFSASLTVDPTAPYPELASNDLTLLASIGTICRFACRFNINDFDFGTRTYLGGILGFIAFASSGLPIFYIAEDGANVFAVVTDTAGDYTGVTDIGDGIDHTIEVRVQKETGPVAGDGEIQLYVDGVLDANSTTVTNWNAYENLQNGVEGLFALYTGAPSGGSGQTGTIRLDDIVFRDDDTVIYPPVAPPTDAWTAAPMTKPASIDADGAYIYIAALNNSGFPALIQFPTALNADGAIVYNPGAGTDIGVQCSPTNPAIIWAAGELGGTDTVVRSDDAAATFPVVDPGTFDLVLSFATGPDDDQRCIIATETPGGGSTASLFETLDAGGLWETRITGLTSPSRILAIARLQINPDEIVIGNGTSIIDRSAYSPNAGVNLEDLTAGTFDADATGVIVG